MSTTIMDRGGDRGLPDRGNIVAQINGGGGGIGGSIADTQVAFGQGTNIAGSPSFNYTEAPTPSLRVLNGSDLGLISAGTLIGDICQISTFLLLAPAARTDLGTPQEGMIYQDSTDHHLYVYNGTAWKQLDN